MDDQKRAADLTDRRLPLIMEREKSAAPLLGWIMFFPIKPPSVSRCTCLPAIAGQ
jgi:hypothetical protein